MNKPPHYHVTLGITPEEFEALRKLSQAKGWVIEIDIIGTDNERAGKAIKRLMIGIVAMVGDIQ